MTTFSTEMKTCAVCGHRSEQHRVESTSAFGSSDLDLRPSEPERSTISLSVQACPGCGYCVEDISTATFQARETVETPRYKEQLRDGSLPVLANRFLCLSMIEEASGDLEQAAWAIVRAAWACDDAGNEDGARRCRIHAADLLDEVRTVDPPPPNWAMLDSVIADLRRRAGELERAQEALDRAAITDWDVETTIGHVLWFLRRLVSARDTAPHTVAEANTAWEGAERELRHEIPRPDPRPSDDRCAVCGEDLLGVTCVTCGFCGRSMHVRCALTDRIHERGDCVH